MNKTFFILALFFIFTLSQAQKSFEGFIKFSTHISATNLAPKDFKKQVDKKYGDSLIMYYSANGNFKRIHKNSSATGKDSQLYLADKGVLYITDKQKHVDSLNVKINSIELISEGKTNNETIMGLDCNCYQYEAKSKFQQHVILTYCYSEKTPEIDGQLYSKHNDFFINNFYKLAKRPYLKFSIQTEEFNITYLAHQLKNENLNLDLFQLK